MSLLRPVAYAIFLGAFSLSAGAQDRDWSSFVADANQFSDEALAGGAGSSAALVGSKNCKLSSTALITRLDKHLSDAAADAGRLVENHAPWGLPTSSRSFTTLVQNGYVVLYDTELKMPVAALYRLDRADIVSRTRENCFREDTRLASADRSTLDDYDEPVFDRGHLVPRSDLNRSENDMLNSFVLSNIMPQHDNFNQGTWERFERLIRRSATQNGSVFVITGAVFDHDGDGAPDPVGGIDRILPEQNVGLATHFYKIVLAPKPNGFIDVRATMLPHVDGAFPKDNKDAEHYARIEDFIVSIDEIEAATGFDFLPEMAPSKQKAVERAVASGW